MLSVKVDELEYDIGFKHWRYDVPLNTCGSTECRITVPDNALAVSFGHAHCSIKDNFSRAIGRKVSLGRALIAAFPDKEDRRYVWEQYFLKQENDRKKSKAAQAKKVLVFQGEEHVFSEVK